MRAMEVLLLALLSGSDVGSSTVHLLPVTRDQLCITNGIISTTGHATLGMVCHLSRMGLHSARCGTLPSSEHKPSSPLYHSRELAPRIPRREDDAHSSLNPEKPRLGPLLILRHLHPETSRDVLASSLQSAPVEWPSGGGGQ